MRGWAQARSLWRRWVARERVERDLDAEVRSYVDLLTEEKVAAGMPPDEARRAAAVEAGGVEQVKQAVRQARLGAWIDDAVQDVRFGARLLLRTPGFTAAAVVALSLGIGAATVIFGAVDAVLLRPLAYAEPDRLVVILHDGRNPVSPLTYANLRDQARAFDALGAAEYWRANIAGEEAPETVLGVRLTAATLSMTGVPPLLGRLFTADEEQAGQDQVAVLGHGLWQRAFAGDPGVLGRAVRLNGTPYTVIGVMPADFDFPPFWARGAQLWAPLALRERLTSGSRSLRIFARLAPGVGLEGAQQEMEAIIARGEKDRPASMRGLTVRSLQDTVVRNIRPALLVLLGAVGLLLLIACANVAHMLLARAAARTKEIAVRTALGAGRGRVVRQLLTESVLLALLGAAGGVLLAFAGARLLVDWRPASIPRIETMSVDGRVLAVAVGMALLCGLAFGLAPALQASRRDVQGTLREGERGSTEGSGRRRLRSSLVASEVALALVLLVGAGLLIRTFAALQAIDPGFEPRGVLTMIVSVTGSKESAPERRATFFREVLDRVRALPGVESASAINHLPMAGDIWGWPFYLEGRPLPGPGEASIATYRVVLPGYFQAMHLPLVRGRDFTDEDVLGAPGVVIVNQSLAEKHWPGREPIGQRLTQSDPRGDTIHWLTVVGVAKNAVRSRWAAKPDPELYVPVLQARRYLEEPAWQVSYLTFVIRTAGDPAALAPTVRGLVRHLAPDAAVADVQTMDEVVAKGMAEPRLYLILLGSFATVALVLAAVGIYGVVSYTVSRRHQEIAIRMALGARPADVLRLVLGQGMATVSLGTVVGLLAALALSRTLTTLLYGVDPADPVTLAVVVLALGTVAFVATYLPARRAVAIRALGALRHD